MIRIMFKFAKVEFVLAKVQEHPSSGQVSLSLLLCLDPDHGKPTFP